MRPPPDGERCRESACLGAKGIRVCQTEFHMREMFTPRLSPGDHFRVDVNSDNRLCSFCEDLRPVSGSARNLQHVLAAKKLLISSLFRNADRVCVVRVRYPALRSYSGARGGIVSGRFFGYRIVGMRNHLEGLWRKFLCCGSCRIDFIDWELRPTWCCMKELGVQGVYPSRSRSDLSHAT